MIDYSKEPFKILNGHPFSALLVSSMRRGMFKSLKTDKSLLEIFNFMVSFQYQNLMHFVTERAKGET
jgi:hypothetical protein